MILSKTNYILYRECQKSTWFKIHKPDIYYQHELTAFEKMIIQTGTDVELVARKLFPSGVLIQGRDAAAQARTHEHIQKKSPVLFQAVFEKDEFLAATDVLELNPKTNAYTLSEIKSTNDIDEKTHHYDLAFQAILLRKAKIPIEKMNLIHLNKDYVRNGALNTVGLFAVEDVTEIIESLVEGVAVEMDSALAYLSQEALPEGFCMCIYKGRSNHCSCFSVLNPGIPEYGIHDIARIGSSKKKLEELVDGNNFRIEDVPPHIQLSTIQQNQIEAHKLNRVIVDKDAILRELRSLQFPLYFLDYETLPCAIPRFDSFSPYQHIPFQYSLYVLDKSDGTPRQLEFLHTDADDPSPHFIDALKRHVGYTGSILVWHKSFECGRNTEIAKRIPEMQAYVDSLNGRVYDLEEIFKKQYFVHKGFRGSTSIKKVLPVLVPSLTYTELDIHDGGAAAEIWNKLTSESISVTERQKIETDLKKYCGLDAYAMYAIWKELNNLVAS